MAGPQHDDETRDNRNNLNQLQLDALMAKLMSPLQKEFENLRADIAKIALEKSRKIPQSADAESYKRSSRADASRRTSHDREEPEPKPPDVFRSSASQKEWSKEKITGCGEQILKQQDNTRSVTWSRAQHNSNPPQSIDAGSVARKEPLDKKLDIHRKLVEQEGMITSTMDEEQKCEEEKRPEILTTLVQPAQAPFDLAARGIIITTVPTRHSLFDTKMSEPQTMVQSWQNFLTGHSFKLNVFNFPISSLMHLFCPISAQKDAGTLEKHQPLEVGDELDTLAIKGKPPDLQEFQPNQRRTKRGTMSELQDDTRENDELHYHQGRELMSYFQFKDEPPDAAFKLQLSQHRVKCKGGQIKNVQEYRLPRFVLSICVKEEPPDLDVNLSRLFEGTAGVILMQATTKRAPKLISNSEAAKKRPRRTTKREEDERFKPPDLDQDKQHDISVFIMIKDEPPDATNKPNLIRFQGKYKMVSSFNDTDLVSFLVDEPDLRTNPFQVGEDDMIMASKETKETKEHKEQLVQEETQDQKEDALHISLGPMTRAKSKEFQQAFYSLLHQVKGNLKCAESTTLVVIHAT